jgi:outer membrane protein assembly factor BamA
LVVRIGKQILCFAVLAGLTVAGASSQTARKSKKGAPAPPAPPATRVFPIEAVFVEGNAAYSTEAIVGLTGLRLGEPGSKEVFEAARDRLLAEEIFSSVGFRYEPGPSGTGYAVTFEVVEIDQRFPFRVAGLPGDEKSLREYLRRKLSLYTEEIPATKVVLDRYGAAIREYLAANGVEVEEIRSRVTADRPDELFVLFFPKGSLPVVAEVHFRGNQAIPTPILQNTIARVAVGSEYREERFRELLDRNIRPLYEARGRVRVSFPKLETRPADGADGLAVTVDVEEGETYYIGEVAYEGVGSAGEGVRKSSGLKSGDLAAAPQVEAALERVASGFRNAGHMKVAVTHERSIDDENKKVNYVIRVDPGPQYAFGQLFVKGLDILGEAEIKRLWGLDPGKPFQASYPDFFLAQVREQRIFENLGETRAILSPNDAKLTVDVTLEFSAPARQRKSILK